MTQPAPPSAPSRAAPRWRRAVGAVVGIGGVGLAAAAVTLAAVSSHTVLVRGEGVVGRPALLGTAALAGLAVAGGHLLSRPPGRARPVERAVLWGLAATAALWFSVALPMLGFLVMITAMASAQALATPVPVVLLVVVMAGAAAALRHRAPRTAADPTPHGLGGLASAILLSGGIALLGFAVLGWALGVVDDEVVVARGPGGCTAVVRQTQDMFTGDVVLFVAAPGSSVAERRASFRLEETFPFRTGDYVLDPGDQAVRIAFDDGLGGVDETVPCR